MWAAINIATAAAVFVSACLTVPRSIMAGDDTYPYLCAAIIILSPMVAILGTYYGLAKLGVSPLPRPSFSRNPLRFWRDPFQFLTTASVVSLANTLGMSPQYIFSTDVNVQTYSISAAFSGGILVGLGLSYWIFRDKMAAKGTAPSSR